MRKFFLTFGYVGCIKYAPGTFGSIAAVPFAFLILYYFGEDTLFLLALLLGVIGVVEVNKYEKQTNTHDDKRIVIDEVVGVFFALCMCHTGVAGCLMSVVFFRGFDIVKPSIIGRIDSDVKGGFGVMLDDVLAGIFAGLFSNTICHLVIKYINADMSLFGVKIFWDFFCKII